MSVKVVQKIGSSWYVWIFPAFAVIISVLLGMRALHERGPTIQIEVHDASGVESQKTKVRYRGVDMGTVTGVILDKEDRLQIEVRLTRAGARFATQGSHFSVVRPKASFQGVSGLNTILEGLYIEAYPGDDDGAKLTKFKATESPVEKQENTSEFELESSSSESIAVGDSITFRGVHVGSIVSKALSHFGTRVNIRIAMENADTYLIRENTKFWRKVGVQAKLGLFGAKIKMNSLESIVNGGVEIATPEPAGPRAKAGHHFGLDADAPKDYEKWAPELK